MFTQKTRLEGKTVGTKLAPRDYKKMEELVKKGAYLGVSDFIRDAIKEKLQSIEVIELREVGYKQAKKEVLEYYKHHGEAYPSDAADDLQLDFKLVHKIVAELRKEGKLGDAE